MKKLSFIVALFLYFQFSAFAQSLQINPDRLHENLMTLATFGKNAQGGSDRVAFSTHDVEARKFVKSLMEKAGLEVSIDFAGNLIGRKAGKNPNHKPISFGSHIDEVPNGGDYDGPVGSLGAIEVVQTLSEKGVMTDHPLEVIIFTNEEGGVVGSRAIVGALNPEALQVVAMPV